MGKKVNINKYNIFILYYIYINITNKLNILYGKKVHINFIVK